MYEPSERDDNGREERVSHRQPAVAAPEEVVKILREDERGSSVPPHRRRGVVNISATAPEWRIEKAAGSSPNSSKSPQASKQRTSRSSRTHG